MNNDMNAELSIDTEGNVIKCAKNATPSECGFKPGADICAKCGAMPVTMKMVPVDVDDDDFVDILEKAAAMGAMETEDMAQSKKKKPMAGGVQAYDAEEGSEGDLPLVQGVDPLEEDASEGHGPKVQKRKMAADPEDMADGGMDEDTEDAYGMPIKKKKMAADEEDMADGGVDEDTEDAMTPVGVNLEAMRKKRLATLGTKAADVGRNAYLCSVERKVYPGGTSVCEDCPGGCVPEGGMPGLLHVEGIAEDMFAGKVLDSGYSSDADMFVVDVQAKDGRSVEVFIDGTTAEVLGWHKLDEDSFEQKSALDSMMVINFQEAAEIAVKSIEGDVVAVEPDMFEGFDAYAVEINGIDGKSYDVFVGLDGEVLGYDRYEPEQAADIEAEAAEIALKRAFTEDQRNSMAKEGNALPDGSYPIANAGDLRNAISAYGRAKDKEAAKRHIMKRAKALGQEKMIPVSWLTGASDSMNEKSVSIEDQDFISSLIEFELLNSDTDGDSANSL